MTTGFVDVTEIEGQRISAEQLFRISHRYHWAARFCSGKDVLEVACGAGLGLAVLRKGAKSVTAGDISPEVLANARCTFGETIPLSVFGAEELPFADASFDAVLMFEALYYVSQPGQFFREAHRVLRRGGVLLIVSANKDLYDFSPSPFSHAYLGVNELVAELRPNGFEPEFAALIDTRKVGFRQRFFRPIKSIATKLGLMPRTMHGKAWLKKIFFGEMVVMPADISQCEFNYFPPNPIPADRPDLTHKVIYCSAKRD